MLRRSADVLSPARIFGLTWSIVLGLADLKFSKLQIQWTTAQWFLLLLGPFSFLLGLFIMYVLNIGYRLDPIDDMRRVLREQKINRIKLFYSIIIAFVTYIAGLIVIDLAKGSLPIFAADPSAARTEFSLFGVGMLIYNMPVVVFFSIIYHLLVREHQGKKFFLKVVVLVTLLAYLFLLQRYAVIMISLIAFTLLYYTTPHIRFKTMMIFMAFAVFVFYSIATIRSGQIIQLALYKTSLMKFPPRYAFFTEPYLYITMNVENFVNSVSKLTHYSFGYYTFDFVFSFTQLKYPMKEYFGFVDTPHTLGGFNTYTLFWTFYRDYGILGISAIPLALGLFVGVIYYSMRRNPTIQRVSFYSVIVFVMTLSFFINLLGFLWFIYIITWMVVILRLIRLSPFHGTVNVKAITL